MTQGADDSTGQEMPDFDVTMAFQPIVDAHTGRAFAYEALVRGRHGETAAQMLARVRPETRYAFDQQCRVAAIRTAVDAGIVATGALLSINFMPDVVESPIEHSQATLRTARETGFPPDRLMFEFSERDRHDPDHLRDIIAAYRRLGFATAFDDFGNGLGGLGLLSRFTPDFIKLDPELVCGLGGSWARRLVIENLARLAHDLNIAVIAEGVESESEYVKLRALGIRYMQGYHLARPAIGRLPAINRAVLAATA